jgi:hypothetical protein
MKNEIIILVVFILASVLLNAQTPAFKCGTDEYLKQQKKSDPTLESKMILQEQQIQQWIKENNYPNSKAVITIPVVVHIVYNSDEQNVSDQRVLEQIAISNRDFAGLNPHSMVAFSDTLKANTGIQFCLAQKDPYGSPTTGIERKQTSITSFIMNNAVKKTNTGGLDAWDPTRYFNIWVCNLVIDDGSGYVYSGYAQFPNSGLNPTFGVVIRSGAFGPTDSSYFRGNGGITTHEIGHCLYLYHIWGDDTLSCKGTDNCDDTPNQAGRTTGFHSGILTDACTPSSPGIMYMNFMDYSDDIVFANFTPNQTARIQAMFESPYGYLLPLANSDACSPPTSCITNANLSSADFNVFPNPVKEQAFINYSLRESAIVSFTITNSLGIEIARICNNQIQNPDNYNTNYNVRNLPSGLYYLTMRAENFTKKKKLVVIR